MKGSQPQGRIRYEFVAMPARVWDNEDPPTGAEIRLLGFLIQKHFRSDDYEGQSEFQLSDRDVMDGTQLKTPNSVREATGRLVGRKWVACREEWPTGSHPVKHYQVKFGAFGEAERGRGAVAQTNGTGLGAAETFADLSAPVGLETHTAPVLETNTTPPSRIRNSHESCQKLTPVVSETNTTPIKDLETSLDGTYAAPSSQRATRAGTAKAKPSDTVNPLTLTVYEAYAARRGTKDPAVGANTKAAKWMLGAGFTPEQIDACHAWLVQDPWYAQQAREVTLSQVQERIGRWVKVGCPSRYSRDWRGQNGEGAPSMNDKLDALRQGVRDLNRGR